MGDIGNPVRRREYVPMPESEPVHEPTPAPAEPAKEPAPVPAEPVKTPEKEPVPA